MEKLSFLSPDYWNRFYVQSDWGQPRQETLEIVKELQGTFRTQTIRILDLGCGDGRYSIPFAELGATVDSVDFSEEAINRLVGHAERKGVEQLIHAYHCNALAYTIESGTYHLIFSS